MSHNLNNGINDNKKGGYKEERVVYKPSPLNNGECIPFIEVSIYASSDVTVIGEEDEIETFPNKISQTRPFFQEDIYRVLDYDNLPSAPPDGRLRHLELSLNEQNEQLDLDAPPQFLSRNFCLRGCFLFYFDCDKVHRPVKRKKWLYDASPLGVIPLERTVVEFPPGGRRAFREHAMTEARNGYEFAIRHVNRFASAEINTPNISRRRAPAYLVAESSGERELWASGIRLRSEYHRKDTRLRPEGTFLSLESSSIVTMATEDFDGTMEELLSSPRDSSPEESTEQQVGKKTSSFLRSHYNRSSFINLTTSSSDEYGKINDDELQKVLDNFSKTNYDGEHWADEFYRKHDHTEATNACSEIEQWKHIIHNGLRGAVFEQYKYFVEASREMTQMGREIMTLRHLVQIQVDEIDYLKSIDFANAFGNEFYGIMNLNFKNGNDKDSSHRDIDYDMFGDEFSSRNNDKKDDHDREEEYENIERKHQYLHSKNSNEQDNSAPHNGNSITHLFLSKPMSDIERLGESKIFQRHNEEKNQVSIQTTGQDMSSSFPEVLSWVVDTPDEISAFIKECRYASATNILLKAKDEVSDCFYQLEKFTDRKCFKTRLASLQRVLRLIDTLSDQLCRCLLEGLRRRNEMLKQATKSDRADPLSHNTPMISPTCLDDDIQSLKLLIRLGKSHDAAVEFSNRRSLLLMECLHERPIVGKNLNVNQQDRILYASFLCRSFFACLSICVERFLDLFFGHSGIKPASHGNSTFPTTGGHGVIEDSDDISSINSSSGQGKHQPVGALASVALWCDAELSRFSSVFAVNVLGDLSFYALGLDESKSNAITGRIDKFETQAEVIRWKDQLYAAEETREHARAKSLRRKIAILKRDQGHRIDMVKKVPSKSTKCKVRDQENRLGMVENLPSKNSTNEKRQMAIKTIGICVDQAFHFASEHLNSIGLPLTPRLAEYIRPHLKGCEATIAREIEDKWDHIIFDWKHSSLSDINVISSPRSSRKMTNTSDF